MKGFGPETYGDVIAGAYDGLYADAPENVVDRLAELAGGGPALELGIGTGRVAVPLAARGVEVHGIDASVAMLEELRKKPGAAGIEATLGDFGEVETARRYRLVYVVFNTFFALTTQDEQLSCFTSVAERLEPGGVFLLELFYPDLSRFDRGQTVRATSVALDAVQLEVTTHDAVRQTITNQHVVLSGTGTRLYPVVLRYAWPSELDLMARAAGLRLRGRWGDWDGAPFTSTDRRHISIYERAKDH